MKATASNSLAQRPRRVLLAALPAIVAAVLAGCGGGSSSGHHRVPPPPPCISQASQGDGFAIGSCGRTVTNVFQPIDTAVAVPADVDSYALTLVFPATLTGPGGTSLDGTTDFTAANKAPEVRNVVGVLRGQAYENPAQPGSLNPPYVALTDFFTSREHTAAPASAPLLMLTYASFGTWEKFAGTDFDEGYLGGWYSGRPQSTSNLAPTTGVQYSGQVVGIIAPESPAAQSALNGRFGFSGPITIDVGAASILSATIGQLKVTFRLAGDTNLSEDELALRAIGLGPSVGAAPAMLEGTLHDGGGGQPGDASVASGAYEARFFGAPGHQGEEIAGRFRFRTSNGLVAVGSFGARQPIP